MDPTQYVYHVISLLIFLFMHVYMYVCMQVCICMCKCVNICIHVYIYKMAMNCEVTNILYLAAYMFVHIYDHIILLAWVLYLFFLIHGSILEMLQIVYTFVSIRVINANHTLSDSQIFYTSQPYLCIDISLLSTHICFCKCLWSLK